MTTWSRPLWRVLTAALIASAPNRARAEQAVAPEPAAAEPVAGEPGSPPELAAGAKSSFGGELRLYMGFGGEKIAEVEYSNGSRSDLSLGTYFLLGLGGIYCPWQWRGMGIDLELFAGWGTWSTGPENTDDRLGLSRFPIEALAYYRQLLSDTPDAEMLLRVGGGATYHLIGGVSGSGSLEGTELDFDNALGAVLEASLVYTALAGGIRYVPIRYRVSASGETLDASSLGLFLSLQLEPGL